MATLLIDLDADSVTGSNGDPVPTFPDVSGNSRDFTQANSSDQPALVTAALNGRKAVRFTDDVVTNAATGITGQTAFTAFLVMAVDSMTDPDVRSGILTGTDGGPDYFQSGGNFAISTPMTTGHTSWASLAATGSLTDSNDVLIGDPAQPFGTFAVVAIEAGVDGADLVLYVNGAAQSGVTGRSASAVSLGKMHLGDRDYGAGPAFDRANFTLARMQLYAGRLTTPERDAVTSDLGSTYGISVTTSAIIAFIDGSLPALSGALAASVGTSGALQGDLPMLGGSLAAEVGSAGLLQGVLPALSGSLTAELGVSGLLGGALPSLGGSLAVANGNPATISGALPTLAGSLAADVYTLEALLSGVLPTLGGSLTGEVATLATIGGALPTLGGSLTDFVESVGPDAMELLVNRINTRSFIRADPVSIILRTRTLARTPSGAYEAGSVPGARSRQVFKLIMQSPAGGSIEQRTEDGTERQVDYILLGEWDAEIEVSDYWDDEAGQRWEVVALVPRNGYETRAVVEAHGKDLTGG